MNPGVMDTSAFESPNARPNSSGSDSAQVRPTGVTAEGVDIFQVFYQNGQTEEIEVEEIANCLEPLEDMAGAPEGFSAPELARRALRQRGLGLDLKPRTGDPRYVASPGDVADLVARSARLHARASVRNPTAARGRSRELEKLRISANYPGRCSLVFSRMDGCGHPLEVH